MEFSQALIKSLLCVLALTATAVFFRWKRKGGAVAPGAASWLCVRQVVSVGPRQKLMLLEFDKRLKLLFLAEQTACVLAEKDIKEEAP